MRRILAFVAPLAVVAVSIALTWSQNVSKPTNKPTAWQEVERLISEQKFEEASAAVVKIRDAARAAGNQDEWTRALVTQIQLRTGLHGYETSVRELKEQPWPTGLLNRATLNLLYAHSLVTYYRGYSWEINRREPVQSSGPVDLKAWTRDQLFAEARKAYDEVWKQRAELGDRPVGRLSEYLNRNNYPDSVRGTLRDAISYMYAELVSDTSFWRPEESNEIYRLNLKSLLASGAQAPLLDPAVHPLRKVVSILDDLESWHASAGRQEAALEARLERLRRLQSSFSDEGDRTEILRDLESRLPNFRGVPWWSMGQLTRAEFVQAQPQTGKLVRARAIAEEGWKAYPDSIGGKRCLHLVKSIEAPDFTIASMSVDGPRRRSVEVSHKNISTLYFRAYPYDLESRLGAARDYNLLPNEQEQQKAMAFTKPEAEWRVDLPATPDFETHRTFVTPPLAGPGYYFLVASARPDFVRGSNRLIFTGILISDLVLVTSNLQNSEVEARLLSGENGIPVQGAQIDLYRFDWQTGHRRADQQTTDDEGKVRFSYVQGRDGGWYFLFAKRGRHVALDPQSLHFYPGQQYPRQSAVLMYTDRSVYRPLQKVFWKALAYEGDRDTAVFSTVAGQTLVVSLVDANHQVVENRTVTTNEFGSAAGEFSIPAGRLLGGWEIRAPQGSAHIRVEEYKRPTFEVTMREPGSALKLNRPATLTGEVKYYFGLPVVNGTVRWRATREPVYPYWWYWYEWGGGHASGTQTVAAGTTSLNDDGTFKIEFTPEADEREAAKSADVSYRYNVSADVTDEGGETRSASHSFRLGFVSVEARIDSENAFFNEQTPSNFKVFRTDLNGTPRPGAGTWRIVGLKQPAAAVLPADLPVREPAAAAGGVKPYRTAGDALRPRWDASYTWKAVLHDWADGAELGRGSVTHDERGEARLAGPALGPGAYRLYYETVDDFGAACRRTEEFVVAGRNTPLALPALLLVDKASQTVGSTARFLAMSGLPGQTMTFEIWRSGRLAERRRLVSGSDPTLIEMPIVERDRGGFSVRLTVLKDYQFINLDQSVYVPWDNKALKLEFSSFRDKLRPGSKETWRITVKSPSGEPVEARAAEILGYMYDRSLDIFASHTPPNPLGVYPGRTGLAYLRTTLGQAHGMISYDSLYTLPSYPDLQGDRLKFFDGYGIGGPGARYRMRGGVAGGVVGGVLAESSELRMAAPAPAAAPARMMKADSADFAVSQNAVEGKKEVLADKVAEASEQSPQAAMRTDFAETAFWRPQLLTDETGSAAIEFTVPDSVTSWNVWAHAVTRDLKGGTLHATAQSVKELMVRPYLPRFLREGDKAAIKVVVNNASDHEFNGKVNFDIVDPESGKSLLADFGLQPAESRPFTVKAGGGANVVFLVSAPAKVGTVAFKVTAAAGDTSDGELRPLPVLPGRMHLSQSRFVTLKNADRREMVFADLKSLSDPTRINEQLVVTLDAQLFYSVLSSLPYLVNYPYECTEQTLNRFVSTGILSGLYQNYPAVARMAQEFAKRPTRLETWDAADPNRKMTLEESPWLEQARGGRDPGFELAPVLDPRVAAAERASSLAKLRKSQTAVGGFPWWPGGPPSPYMTLYIMYGMAKAAEFGVDVPKDMVQKGWSYLAQHFREEYAKKMIKEDCCWEFLTFLNYTASCYPDPSWMGDALTAQERKAILDHCFKHWKQHSPYLKSQLALTLKRMGRPADATLVFASVMDSAKTTQDEGTFWAPEDRSWLWYNDTIETQAFALRTVMELTPADARKDGLVQWLFLNKKLNHWKSTRATAEVIYSLVHYLQKEGALGTREDATVRVGGQTVQYVFEPDKYTGKKNQTVIPGEKVNAGDSTITVEKQGKGIVFASATWQFSTEKLPEVGSGDFLSVSRTYFKREHDGREYVLKPLVEGAILQPGDQLEVQLSIRARHACEYVHLRDPRAAGFEPESAVSRYRWDGGIARYEETRDSGTNFFFEWLPAGEYTLKYRVRAGTAGTYKAAPATLQSMYAPEFTAYSAGAVITIK
jgi:alpha-2-macroglobulin